MERLTYIIVLIVYLTILAVVGMVTSRRLKTSSDFAIGGRSIGPWVTALSFVAAYFSSVLIIGGGGFGYRFGLATLWIGAANVSIGCMLAWIVLGKRIRKLTEETDSVTISEFLGKRYASPAIMIFSAAIIFLFLIIYNVSVVKGMANAIQVLMDVPYLAGVLISGIIIVFYVSVGGYLAVVWTSFIQAWIMIAGLLLLTGFTLHRVGGLAAVAEKLAAIDPGYVTTPGIWGWAGLISFCLVVSLGTWGMPQLVIRFYSIKNARVLRVGTVVVTIGAAVALLPYLNGAIARILHPDLANPDLAIPTLTRSVLPPIGGAIFLAGVIAAGMSTFAGVLIITSTSLVRDIFKGALKREITPGRELGFARRASALVGVISILLAIRPPGLVLVLTAFAWAVIASTNLWPMLFGIYWRRTNPTSTLASMIIGAAVAIVWPALGSPFGLHGFIAGTAAALVTIFVGTLIAPAAVQRPGGGYPRDRGALASIEPVQPDGDIDRQLMQPDSRSARNWEPRDHAASVSATDVPPISDEDRARRRKPAGAGRGRKAGAAPRRARSGRRKGGESLCLSSAARQDQVQCSVFAPRHVPRPGDFMVQVFAHALGDMHLAESLAKQFDAETETRGVSALTRGVERGSLLTFHLDMPGLGVKDEVKQTIWRGKPESVQYVVTVPREFKAGQAYGTVTISYKTVPIGQIVFKVTVVPEKNLKNTTRVQVGKAVPFNVFFISYAAKDRAEVVKRLQILTLMGKNFFQDLLDLDPGDRWQRKLYKLIDESDATLLFWSSNARESEWVLKECRYTIEKKGLERLIPVIIEGPPPVEPPAELAELHMNDRLLYFQ